MKYQIKRIKDCKNLMQVEVSAKDLEQRFHEVLLKFQKKASLKGFREGKAPLDLIESTFRGEANEEVVQSLVSESYYDSIRESKMTPVGSPLIKDLKHEQGKRLTFTAEFETSPQFNLKNYRGMKIQRFQEPMEIKNIEEALESLRESRAEIVPLEVGRPVIKGDVIRCDIETRKDGRAVPSQSDVLLTVEAEGPQTEFFDQLVGAEVGEWKEVTSFFSEEEKRQGLVGRKPFCRILVKEIKSKRLPELNDAFASSFGKANMDELRSQVKHDLERLREQQANERMKEQIYEQLLKSHDLEIPQGLVERQKKRLMEQHQTARSRTNGSSRPDDEVALSSQEEEIITRKARDQVKLYFILEKIAETERIEPDKNELEQQVRALAVQTRRSEDEIRKMFEDDIHHNLKQAKTVDYLIAHANVKEQMNG